MDGVVCRARHRLGQTRSLQSWAAVRTCAPLVCRLRPGQCNPMARVRPKRGTDGAKSCAAVAFGRARHSQEPFDGRCRHISRYWQACLLLPHQLSFCLEESVILAAQMGHTSPQSQLPFITRALDLVILRNDRVGAREALPRPTGRRQRVASARCVGALRRRAI